MKKKKNKKFQKAAGSYPDESYVPGTIENLHLDKEIKALPSTHNRVNGKDIPVNKQIIDYLKSMGLIESQSLPLLSEENLRKMIRKILIENNI